MRLRGKGSKGYEEASVKKASRQEGQIRVFCRSSKNPAWCAKVGWEKVAVPGSLYGCDVIRTSEGWIKKLERIEYNMGRYITGASKTCARVAMDSEIGWTPVRVKVAMAKLIYARRFEWEVNGWGRTCWEVAQGDNGREVSGWWKQVVALAEEYMLELDEPCGSLSQWKQRVKSAAIDKAVRSWKEKVGSMPTAEVIACKSAPQWEPYMDGSWGGANVCLRCEQGTGECGEDGSTGEGCRILCVCCVERGMTQLHMWWESVRLSVQTGTYCCLLEASLT